MIRAVFDTNILFSAVFKRAGVPAQVLDLVTTGVLTPCVSGAIMAEYLDVLARPVLRPHAARAREVLGLLALFAVHVFPSGRSRYVPILTTTGSSNALRRRTPHTS